MWMTKEPGFKSSQGQESFLHSLTPRLSLVSIQPHILWVHGAFCVGATVAGLWDWLHILIGATVAELWDWPHILIGAIVAGLWDWPHILIGAIVAGLWDRPHISIWCQDQEYVELYHCYHAPLWLVFNYTFWQCYLLYTLIFLESIPDGPEWDITCFCLQSGVYVFVMLQVYPPSITIIKVSHTTTPQSSPILIRDCTTIQCQWWRCWACQCIPEARA